MSASNPVVSLSISADGSPIGNINILLRADVVPKTVENFLKLCTDSEGFGYAGSKFNRVIPNFMAQSGALINRDGTCGESINNTLFEDENFILKHDGPGTVAMANFGPNTNDSQFFITFVKTDWLDNKHVVFGKVIEGMDTLKKIEEYGSQSGKSNKSIIISDCRQLS
ncbi:cyclophilin D At 1.7 A Resolution, Dmso complex [Kickxella alabastrina]|uniref:cyclophilin D At 1.7 A Resolution, Dmso complex n=1 Tax=Kickxella alabastrina TaxID=61397 RepID=UPI0022204A78|nr:cyclophilin D At 1.7 A Resolution, Dmso complex [Kickxella alabastrina]KAI7834193.1 cyclophilin D At 1.7 A Resolution, Dmso complex [Kickxella alabastrina]